MNIHSDDAMLTKLETANPSSIERLAGSNGEAARLAGLLAQYRRVRAFTEHLAAPLEIEDHIVQTMESVSPTKWHLAHTTWFFEVFVLQNFKPHYRLYHPEFPYLFNSYYVQAGERHCRDRRGYISRPTVSEVFKYRRHVDEQMEIFLTNLDAPQDVADVVEIGIHHEQQHQELILTDIKHVLSVNPLRPVYRAAPRPLHAEARALHPHAGARTPHLRLEDFTPQARPEDLTPHPHAEARTPQPLTEARAPHPDAEIGAPHPQAEVRAPHPHAEVGAPQLSRGSLPFSWKHFDEGVYEIGHAGNSFCYDNETPRHRHFAEEFLLASRLVTNGEYLEFMRDGGYRRPELWLSEGWATVDENEWSEPFYWELRNGEWWTFTLDGMCEVAENEPVCHLSYFEADAYARWADARLPTEQEWEIAAQSLEDRSGNFVENGRYHPTAAVAATNGDVRLEQMYGDVWEWTRSQYSPYPGYKPLPGALGEYNGKFMCNQFVLRGGSCATSETHIRSTYRNFFSPESTWQFTGLRLARDC